MPSAATAPAVKAARCKRCATILRKARTICPCCNLDVNAPPDEPPPSASGSSAAAGASGTAAAADGTPQKKGPRVAAAKTGVKICPICMATVQEAEMQDFQGKRVCPGCAERMQKTGASAAAPAPVAEQSSGGGGGGGGGGGNMSIEAAATATSDLKSYAHLEEKLKKRLKLVKWVLAFGGGCLLVVGGVTVLTGSAFGKAGGHIEARIQEQIESGLDEDGKKLSPDKIEQLKLAAEKAHTAANAAAAAIKIVGLGIAFVGVLFIVMFFLTNSYPFQASLIALIFYALIELYNFSRDGMPSIIWILIDISIFSSLINGITAGLEINKLRAEKEASKRKPAKVAA